MSDELETAVPESIPADAASAASASESAPVKPKRTTTRKKAAPAAAADDASDGASAAAAEGDAPAAKKPATRKRTTGAKKTPAKTAAAADTEPAVKAPAADAPTSAVDAPAAPADAVGETASAAPKKPAARKTTVTRTRRRPAPAEADGPTAAETAPEAAADAVSASAAAAAPEKAENASETPARTPRTRTRTKAASAASGARSGARKPAASRAKVAAPSSEAAPLAPIEFSSDADVIATETLADPSLTAGQAHAANSAPAAEVLAVEVLVADDPKNASSEILIEASTEASAVESSTEPVTPNRVRRERNNGANNGDRSNNERNGNNNKKRSKQNQNQNQNQGSSDKNSGQNQQGQNNQNQSKNNNNNNKGAFDRDHRRQRRQHGSREVLPSISRDELAEMKVGDLREKAAEYSIDASGYRKAELVDVVFEALCKAEGIIEVTGILDIMNDGYGFLRTKGYLPSEGDAYVSLSIIRRNGLRKGDYVVGLTRPAQGNEKYAAIQKVISVNDTPADELGGRVRFADLTPIYPDERLVMEHGKSTTIARVIDLVSPIGKGQRGLIVSPPKAGKTTVLKDIAAAISANNPEVHLMCLLVDERPEEVTDMERSIKGEVISSTFDKPCENHIAVAELVIERAKRLVEQERDVVILLDSITRLARAYNMGTPASGRILSGGVDSSALYPPKRFLGAARNIENGGSLTILGTALVDTGSKMDEVIFEEFKGTGNMELKLDRTLADKRIFPAIDPITSGTRKEELLLDPQEAPLIWAVRRVLANLNNTERAMDTLVKSIKQTETNQEFLIRFARKAQNSSKQDSLDL